MQNKYIATCKLVNVLVLANISGLYIPPVLAVVVAEYVFDEMYRTSGMMKFVLDPNINDVQFITKINHPCRKLATTAQDL